MSVEAGADVSLAGAARERERRRKGKGRADVLADVAVEVAADEVGAA